MTAPVLSPVRWWRDDADRYVTRGPQIERGELPSVLRGADWRSYQGREHPRTWEGWCKAWRGIAWVRVQAFEREGEAEWAAGEHEASVAAGGWY